MLMLSARPSSSFKKDPELVSPGSPLGSHQPDKGLASRRPRSSYVNSGGFKFQD